MLDEEIAKAECEKMQLTAKLEQFDLNEAKSKKEVEDIRTHNKKLEKELDASTIASSVAAKKKESSDERLMNIHGIEVYL